MLLTGVAWGIAYTTSFSATVCLTLLFVFVHFLAVSLLVATAAFFLVGRLLGPGVKGLPGRRRQQGLFAREGDGDALEFGYCFDVSGCFVGLNWIERGPRLGGWRLTRGDVGCDQGILPGVGVVVCYAVCALAAHCKG